MSDPKLPVVTPTPEEDLPNWVALGKIGRPHGVRGELRLTAYNTSSSLWKPGLQLRMWRPGAPARMVRIVQVRPANEYWILRLEGIDDRTQAETLTNAELEIDEHALPPPAEDEVYLHELMGAAIIEAEDGAVVGKIVAFIETSHTLMQIKLLDGGEALIPLDAPAVEQLGRERGKVVVRHVEDWRS